jgi:hypothetical protein
MFSELGDLLEPTAADLTSIYSAYGGSRVANSQSGLTSLTSQIAKPQSGQSQAGIVFFFVSQIRPEPLT